MRSLVALLLPLHLAMGCAHVTDAPASREVEDRNAIMETMHQYVWSVDSLDADGYAAVFTADAVIDSNGTAIRGSAAIRKVVTDMQARQDANRAAGKPAGRLYHVISNERIRFAGPNEAIYRSYWQTLRKGADGRYATGGFGRSEDRLTRQRDGQWLITSRKLTVFTE
jgi:ketosteroid isomerase-like protein